MMQMSEIQQRFSQVENTIHRATQASQSTHSVPLQLKDCVQQLDQRAIQAKDVIQQSQEENRIRECIDDLEQLGDRAKNVCEQSESVDEELRDAIMQAHRELSELKHQLH